MVTAEYTVYMAVVEHLQATDWEIVCACPPVGTDFRFQKCNLPRVGAIRGSRDEIDITAVKAGVCILVECKGTIDDSTSRLNRDGESDVEKLQRITSALTPALLASALEQAHGFAGSIDTVRTAIAFESVVLGTAVGVDAVLGVDADVVSWSTNDARLGELLD